MKNPRPLAVALLLSLATPVALPAHRAHAQAADEASTKMARQRFQEGVAYYDNKQYELARASFLQAYALRKHPAVLLNLGLSALRSGHTLEASRDLTQFLREHSGASVAQRTEADRGLREARQKLGRIEIAGAPNGTDIFVDDEKVGQTPLDQPADVEPGTHMVRAHGRLEDAVQVTVNAGQVQTARFGMATPPAAVAVAPTPSPAPETPPSDTIAPPASETPPEEPIQPASAAPAGADSSGRSLWSAPNNVTPVVIGSVLAVAGFGTAIAFFVFKQSAQDNANSVEASIRSAGYTTCNTALPTYNSKAATACSAFNSDRDKVNTDATIGNIGLGVGIAASVITVIYWFAASRSEQTADARPLVTPLIGRGVGGLSLGGSF